LVISEAQGLVGIGMEDVLDTGITKATLGVSSALSALVASLVILVIVLAIRSYRRRSSNLDDQFAAKSEQKMYDSYDDPDSYSTISSVTTDVVY
jgi:hypothetical protein